MTEETMKVYQYIEYNDDYAFGEMKTEIYRVKEDALNALKTSVEEEYGVPFDKVPEEAGLTEDDTFTPEYVSIDNGSSTIFWIVEEKEIQ